MDNNDLKYPVLRSANISQLDILKGLRKGDVGVDLALLQKVASPRSLEMKLRLALLLTGGLAIYVMRGDYIPILFAVFHLFTALGYRLVLSRQSTVVPVARFGSLALADFINVLVYALAILYFGTSETNSYLILALIMFVGFYLHTLGERSRVMVLFVNDVTLQMLLLAALIGWLWSLYGGGDGAGALNRNDMWILTVGTVALHLYFLMLCGYIRRARRFLQDAQDQRVADERLLAIGQLSGGIAHDFNNMLTAVLGNIELVRLTADPVEREKLMNEAESAARHGAELTSQLLAYSRKAQLRPREVDVTDMLNLCLPTIRARLSGDQKIDIDLSPSNLPKVFIDVQQFCSVIISLIDNAVQAMDARGVITLTLMPSYALGELGVSIELRDSGKGISPEILPMVFEPYFTTKPKGQGSGLGLAMARGIVEQSGGRMEIDSQVGLGTTVRIYLPEADSLRG
ncbi:sensor histidine kinase [Primorskyibacter sp. 2E233]|uniref:sensor histidine kinase n=1 Tax=Primorskyibacter sp. 2E233 TaxID=3413431 RepID=UPI003BF22647